MQILTIASAKGGTGKSSSAAALAADFARMGAQVLLCDLDPQAGLTLSLGFDAAEDPWSESPVTPSLPGIKPGAILLRRSGRRLGLAGRTQVEALLDSNPAGADVAILDCAPAISATTVVALERADLALVPLSPAAQDLQGLADIDAILSRLPTAPPLRALLIGVHARRRITREIRELLRKIYPGSVLSVEIPQDARVPEAPSHGLDVTSYAPRSRAALAYRELAQLLATDLRLGSESNG